MPLASLLAMPPADLLPIVPQTQSPSNGMTNHLQRCMDSVQELALSISCALDALHGREKTGSSDIHGSYAKLVADVQQLTSKVQCIHCKRTVAWSHLEPIKPGLGQAGACICMRVATPSTWEPCHDQLLPAPNHLNTSTPQRTIQIPGHKPAQVGQMVTSDGMASPFRNDPIYNKVTEPYDIPMNPDVRKRSLSELSQVQPPLPPTPQMHMMPTKHQSPQASAYETSPGGIECSGHKVQRRIKRETLPKLDNPPKAHDGKYYCNFAPECAGQYFDRECEWRQVRKEPYLIKQLLLTICSTANMFLAGTLRHIGANEPSVLNSEASPIPVVFSGTSARSMVYMMAQKINCDVQYLHARGIVAKDSPVRITSMSIFAACTVLQLLVA